MVCGVVSVWEPAALAAAMWAGGRATAQRLLVRACPILAEREHAGRARTREPLVLHEAK